MNVNVIFELYSIINYICWKNICPSCNICSEKQFICMLKPQSMIMGIKTEVSWKPTTCKCGWTYKWWKMSLKPKVDRKFLYSFKASKHNSDLKEEKKAFMVGFLCYCAFRLIVSHSRGILVLLYVLVLSIQKNDLIVSFFFHVII